jgi:hypothetical protein
MSDARWVEIDDAVASSVKHFAGAVSIFRDMATTKNRYLVEMGFLHAMLAGHTSLEAALLRILELLSEQPPTGASWHRDLIARISRGVTERPPILTGEAAAAAEETRRFRSVAAHAYDNFDEARAAKAVAAAAVLAASLPAEIAGFRLLIDP